MSNVIPSDEEIELFKNLLDQAGFDFVKLAFLIFPYGQEGHELEHKKPHPWQLKLWQEMTEWYTNPETRDIPFKLVISTGNGSGKTAWAAQTIMILMYITKLRCRLTANTKPQLTQNIWPEYDKWFRYARYSNIFFEKFGESIKSRDEQLSDQWTTSLFTWDPNNPAAVSGLHNEGFAAAYVFEEAPGIPAQIYQYANGAFTDINTIKLWLVLGNSDDPDSKFEALMSDPGWKSLRIDTRTLPHISKEFIATVLRECGGDEDADDFRVRVRGLPRKTNADAIINRDKVREAFARREGFDPKSVKRSPCVLTVDTAWQGKDYNAIWKHQGHYHKLMALYKLDKSRGDDHKVTFDILCKMQVTEGADAVLIDKGEGTAIKTLANMAGFYHWDLVDFGSGPNDVPNPKDSDYANMRSQMYHLAGKYFNEGFCILDFDPNIKLEPGEGTVIDKVVRQMGYTKGDRHKITNKKTCENKKELIERVGESPDACDGFIIKFARVINYRLPENEVTEDGLPVEPGSGAWKMGAATVDYNETYDGLYD